MNEILFRSYFTGVASGAMTLSIAGLNYPLIIFNIAGTVLFYLHASKKTLNIQKLSLLIISLFAFIFIKTDLKYFVFLLFPLLYFYNNSSFRLRSIPYLKNFIISFCWAYLLAVLPLKAIEHFSLLLFFELYLFIFILCLPFDWKDKLEDEKSGLKTIAHFPKPLYLLLLIALLLIHSVLYWSVYHSVIYLFMLTLLVAFSHIIPRKFNQALSVTLLIDGLILMRGIWDFCQ